MYEQRMRTYANNALALSTRNAHNAASEARLRRVPFRLLLRLAEAFPPVKRVVFRPTPAELGLSRPCASPTARPVGYDILLSAVPGGRSPSTAT